MKESAQLGRCLCYKMATNAGWAEFEKSIEAVRKQAANRIV
jgi:hypothetical protein